MLRETLIVAMTLAITNLTAVLPAAANPSASSEEAEAEKVTVQENREAESIAQTQDSNAPETAVPAQQPQFSDITPEVWAAESIRSLMENYGCIEGFPDGTFRGTQAMTRYQFAAGLNACLNSLDATLERRIGNLVTKEELATLFRVLSSIFEQSPQQPGNIPPTLPIPELSNPTPSTPEASPRTGEERSSTPSRRQPRNTN